VGIGERGGWGQGKEWDARAHRSRRRHGGLRPWAFAMKAAAAAMLGEGAAVRCQSRSLAATLALARAFALAPFLSYARAPALFLSHLLGVIHLGDLDDPARRRAASGFAQARGVRMRTGGSGGSRRWKEGVGCSVGMRGRGQRRTRKRRTAEVRRLDGKQAEGVALSRSLCNEHPTNRIAICHARRPRHRLA
jgi:hypothetical protein